MYWFIGIKFDKWLKYLKKHFINISPLYWHKLFFITLVSIRNSFVSRKEEKKYGLRIKGTKIKHDPIFILGHWRTGTTLLQTMLNLDENYTTPTLLHMSNPHIFLTLEEKYKSKINSSEEVSRPMDNMQISPNSPGEDEMAVWMMSLNSSYGSRIRTKFEKYYDKYLTFKNVSNEELEEWKKAFLYFIRKQTMRSDKQLILKSPEHTARIKLLLELFPNAKFIHIHRNPFSVFQSTLNLYNKIIVPGYFEKINEDYIIERIIKVFKEMYDAFFDDKNLLSSNQLIEISYDDLVQEPDITMDKIYSKLELDDFDSYKQKWLDNSETFKNYKKSSYPKIDSNVSQKISTELRRYFDTYGYSY